MADPAPWVDVSVPIREGMVHWPGDPPVRVELAHALERGDCCNVTRLSIGAHSGTHVDAPNHFLPDTGGVDAIALDKLMGPARVLSTGDAQFISVADLERHDIAPGERILFKTRNSERCWTTDAFVPDYAYLDVAAAQYLVERRVRTIGVDYLSVASAADAVPTHRALLGAGICIIEGLDLSQVKAGRYELLCLPMRIANADGAPARTMLRAM